MKKFCTCAAALMLAIFFTSCTTGNSTPSVSPTASATDDAAATPSDSPTPEPRTLTVLTFNQDLQPQLNEFTRFYPDVTMNVQYFDYNQYKETFATEMMSGSAPDVIETIGYYNDYGERGLLTDFKTLMANDADFDASQYISNVLKSTEDTNGSMYAFPFMFYYEGFMSVNTSAPASIISDFTSRDRISLEDMMQTYASLSGEGGLEFLNDFYTEGWMFNYVYPAYIDYAGKTCDFTNPAFIQTMKYMKMYLKPMPSSPTVYNCSLGFMDDGEAAKQYTYNWNAYSSPQYFLPFDSNHYEHTIPLTDKNGNVLINAHTLSIYNGSPNKDIAWELTKYLTGNTDKQGSLANQYWSFPVTVTAFANIMVYRLGWAVNKAAGQDEYLTDAPTAKQNALAAFTAINNMPMVEASGQIRSGGSIVDPEFSNFISGATTAEQAAANIQNKVELYLNE